MLEVRQPQFALWQQWHVQELQHRCARQGNSVIKEQIPPDWNRRGPLPDSKVPGPITPSLAAQAVLREPTHFSCINPLLAPLGCEGSSHAWWHARRVRLRTTYHVLFNAESKTSLRVGLDAWAFGDSKSAGLAGPGPSGWALVRREP